MITILDTYQRLLPHGLHFSLSHEPGQTPDHEWRAHVIHETTDKAYAVSTGFGGTVENAINEAMSSFIYRMTTQALGVMAAPDAQKTEA